jgi:proteic killer suppression protein
MTLLDTGHRPPSTVHKRIPDRHHEDLFVGVRSKGFERQSAFLTSDSGAGLDRAVLDLVNGNWRITFRFIESDAELVDYQDYH